MDNSSDWPYPVLAKSRNTGTEVLFTSMGTGILVGLGDGPNAKKAKLGYTSKIWSTMNFVQIKKKGSETRIAMLLLKYKEKT